MNILYFFLGFLGIGFFIVFLNIVNALWTDDYDITFKEDNEN